MTTAYLFPVYVFVHFLTFIWCLYLSRTRHAPGVLIVAMIAAGLVYDNGMLALGHTIGIGPLLETLSWPRFILHALLTPFMMLSITWMARIGGIKWAASTPWQIIMWVLIIGGAALGAYEHIIGAEIVPACDNGILRYTQNLSPAQFCLEGQEPLAGSGPPIPSIVGNVIALVVGFALWRRSGWLWLMLGSIAMFAAASIPISGFGMAPGNGGEVILMVAFAATYSRFARHKSPHVEG